MANFNAYAQVDLSGKGNWTPTAAGYVPGGIQINYANVYEVMGGYIYASGGKIAGQLQSDKVYDPYNNLMSEWHAAGNTYDASAINYLDSGNRKKYLEYIFSLDDDVVGSQYNDKLYGYDGNDWINGWKGNDKLWGGKGNDTFYFEAQNGKDVIKDFNRKQDTIELHNSLAKGFKDVKNAASKYKKGVALKFASDEQIKIEGLKMKQLKKVDFDFV